jgi:hypothetical protein
MANLPAPRSPASAPLPARAEAATERTQFRHLGVDHQQPCALVSRHAEGNYWEIRAICTQLFCLPKNVPQARATRHLP